MGHRASAEAAPVTADRPLQDGVRCRRALRRSFALADNGSLFEVCELCFLLGSLTALLREVEDEGVREQIARDLRGVYQLLYVLRVLS